MGSHYKGPKHEVRALGAYISLMRAAESLTAPLAWRLRGARFTLTQFGVLEALLHLGPLSPCDLARKLLKTAGNMTMVLDNLEKRGVIERKRSADDRRYQVVHLTPLGHRNITSIFPGHAEEIAMRMSVLLPAEQDELRALCRKLGLAQSDPEFNLDPKFRRKAKK